jgi:hypothetical protein
MPFRVALGCCDLASFSASFLFVGKNLVHAFKALGKLVGQSHSPRSPYRITIPEYPPYDLGHVHPSANQCGQQSDGTDWSDLANGSTLCSWDASASCEPRVRVGYGCFPKEKPGCCYQKKGSTVARQAK